MLNVLWSQVECGGGRGYAQEFSCKTNGDKYHILGYGYDLNADAITKTIEMTHKARIDKIYKIEALLKKDFNMTFAQGEIEELLSHNSPGKPHVANLMVRKGYASDITSAFSILNTLHTGSSYLTTEEAIDVILKSGGIPVLAHGILGDGKLDLSESEISSRVSRLRSEGLMGLECYYSTYTREQHEIMRNLAHRENMLITAGSDYHGKNKAINLGDIGLVTINNDEISQFFDAVSDKILRKCN